MVTILYNSLDVSILQMKNLIATRVIEHLVSLAQPNLRQIDIKNIGPHSRLDGIDHAPKKVSNKERKLCVCHTTRQKTNFFCEKCQVPLCINAPCWKLWHNEKNYLFEDPKMCSAVIYRKSCKY